MPRLGATLAFGLAMGLAAPSPAAAQAPANAPESLWTRDRLGGDWGGARDGLGRHGLRFDLWATGFYPTREELDTVSKDIPVLIVHQSGHLATVNSAMLKIMGYDARTKDPDGGVIQRKPGTTEPNGTLEETALFPAVPTIFGNLGPEGVKALALAGSKLWARFDYTTAEEGRRDDLPARARLEPGAQAEGGVADITPLLAAFGGHQGPLDGCAHDAMFRMTASMATSPTGR